MPQPENFGRYQLIAELGRGGMGIVYKAYDPELQRHVALKIIGHPMSSASEKQRFVREANIMAKLNHAHLVSIFDVGEQQGRLFFTMELIDGGSLGQLIGTQKSYQELLPVLMQAAYAVHYVHENGIIHRDLKPANILVTAQGQAKVMDFGLAKETGKAKLSNSRELLGTPEYMSPEQVESGRKKIDVRSDVYALGAILYEILTGRPPFTGNTMAVIYQIANHEVKPPSQLCQQVPRDLETVCMKCLAKDKNRRYSSAREFADDINHYLHGEPVMARRDDPLYKAKKWVGRHKLLFAFAAVSILLLAAVGRIVQQWTPPKGCVTLVSPVVAEATYVGKTGGGKGPMPVPANRFPVVQGRYDLVCRKENHFDVNRELRVVADRETRLELAFEPMLLWQQEMPAGSDVITLADTDHDGETELICCTQAGGVYAYDLRTRERLWHVPGSLPIYRGHIYNSAVAVHDMDRDGFPDLVFAHHNRFMVISGKTHQEIFALPCFWGHSFAIVDAEGDGCDELIVQPCYADMACYRLTDSKNPLWHIRQHPFSRCAPSLLGSSLIYAADGCLRQLDIANGRSQDIIAYQAFPDRIRTATIEGKNLALWCSADGLSCLDLASKTVLWKTPAFPFSSDGFELCDIDNDRVPEIFVHFDRIYCLDLKNGKTRWGYKSDNHQATLAPVVADLDNDGRLEVVAAMQSGVVHVLDAATGRGITTFAGKYPIRSLVLCDADRDGTLEIAALAGDSVYFLRHRQQRLVRIWDEQPAASYTSPAIGDVDGDGDCEAIVGNSSGTVYCLRLPAWQKVWTFRLQEMVLNQPVIADINGDGRQEIVVHAHRSLTVLSAQGKQLWHKTFARFQERLAPVVADIDGDGKQEIITSEQHDGVLHCLRGDTGRTVWQRKLLERVLSRALATDIDGDGIGEVLLPGSDFYADGKGGVLYCLRGKDGSDRWQAKLPSAADFGCELTAATLDGKLVFFVPQIGGWLSCVDAGGHTVWEHRLRGGDVRCKPQVADIDGDGRPEVVVATADSDIHCLSAQDGSRKWRRTTAPLPAHVLDMDWSACTPVLLLAGDIDKDGFCDLLTSNHHHSLYWCSGKDGGWLDDIQEFGNIASALVTGDIDKDGEMDIVFVDGKTRLVCISNSVQYCRRRAVPLPPVYSCYQESSTLALAGVHRLANAHAYSQLAARLQEQASESAVPPHVRFFLRALCALAEGKHADALRALGSTPLRTSGDHMLLRLIAHLNLGQPHESEPLLTFLLRDHMLDFARLHRQYRHLLTPAAAQLLQQMLPKAIRDSRCDIWLDSAYNCAAAGGDTRQAVYLLELSLLYGLHDTPHYAERQAIYLRQIESWLQQAGGIYLLHKGANLLDRAVRVLPDDPMLRELRRRVYAQSQLDENEQEQGR